METPEKTKLTPAQTKALRWLEARGGDGVFDIHGVLLAGGELAPVMRSTWNALAAAGRVEFYGPPHNPHTRRRLRVIAEAA